MSIGLPPTGSTDFTSPPVATTAITFTVPPRLIFFATSGYTGFTWRTIRRTLADCWAWADAAGARQLRNRTESIRTYRVRIFSIPGEKVVHFGTSKVLMIIGRRNLHEK